MNLQIPQAATSGTEAWFRAAGAVTGVGSVPHLDTARAVDFVARVAPEVPFWPQLRRLSTREAMLPQSFGPALRHLTPVRGEYEFTLPADRVDRFAVALERDAARLDPANASGFYAFLDAFRSGAFPHARAIKGQTMGPLTLSCAVTVSGTPMAERDDLLAILADHVVRIASWQAETLLALAPSVIVVLDEAYLGMILRRSPARTGAIVDLLRTAVLRIRKPGVLVGLHCCDEIPFDVLDAVAPDLYSFDAHHGAEIMAGAPGAWRYFAAGGRVAWGWIPTRDDLSGVRPEDVVERWWQVAGRLTRNGACADVARVSAASLVTASCGLAGSSEETCERSFALATEVAQRFAQRCRSA